MSDERIPPQEEFEDWDDSDDGDDDEEFEDCHMDRSGYCGKAGSEECEFECPYNRMRGIKN